MRFLHLADLHFGKSLHGLSLLESGDQAAWTDRFLELAGQLRPDAVVIAGDVYDRGSPSGEAVSLLSRLLTALAEQEIPVLMVAGNHDSAQRLAFARQLLAKQRLYISAAPGKGPELSHVTLTDAHGPVTFWLMPYVYPALIAQLLGEESARDYDGAVRALLAAQPVDFGQRNVLVAHQNVTANGKEAQRGGSESMVGGVGQIDYHAFDGFDYVALGHIHAAFPVGRPTVRYAGSPLCYHFDELRQRAKGPLLVELGDKGEEARVETLHIPPLHPMRELRGAFDELRRAELAETREGEFLRVVLTDQQVTPEAADFFRGLCEGRGSVLMEICSEYNARRTAAARAAEAVRERSVEELFREFYAERCGGETPEAADLALLGFAGELLRNPGTRNAPEDAAAQLLEQLLKQEGQA